MLELLRIITYLFRTNMAEITVDLHLCVSYIFLFALAQIFQTNKSQQSVILQGKNIIADEEGFVCKREDTKNTGCCDVFALSTSRYVFVFHSSIFFPYLKLQYQSVGLPVSYQLLATAQQLGNWQQAGKYA